MIKWVRGRTGTQRSGSMGRGPSKDAGYHRFWYPLFPLCCSPSPSLLSGRDGFLPLPQWVIQLAWGSPSSCQSHNRVLARVLTAFWEGQEAGGQAEPEDTAVAAQGSVSSPSPGPLGQRKPRQEGQSCHQPERLTEYPPSVPPVILTPEPQLHGSSFGTILRLGVFCTLGGHVPNPPSFTMAYQKTAPPAPRPMSTQGMQAHSPPFRKSFLLSDLLPSCCGLNPNLLVLNL